MNTEMCFRTLTRAGGSAAEPLRAATAPKVTAAHTHPIHRTAVGHAERRQSQVVLVLVGGGTAGSSGAKPTSSAALVSVRATGTSTGKFSSMRANVAHAIGVPSATGDSC